MPVLSEQMTDVQPRVSTDGRLRTMAFFLAMRRVPKARQVVMTAGRPGEEQQHNHRGKRGLKHRRGDERVQKEMETSVYINFVLLR